MYWCKSMVWFQVGLVLVILCHKFNRRCLIQITSCSKCSCQNINLNKIFTTHIFFQPMDLLLNFPICWFCASVYFLINWQIFGKKAILGIPCVPLNPGWVLALLSRSFEYLLVGPAHTNEWLVWLCLFVSYFILIQTESIHSGWYTRDFFSFT